MFSQCAEPPKAKRRNRKPVLYEQMQEFLATAKIDVWYDAGSETKAKIRNAAKALGYILSFAKNGETLAFKIVAVPRTLEVVKNDNGNKPGNRNGNGAGSRTGNRSSRTGTDS